MLLRTALCLQRLPWVMHWLLKSQNNSTKFSCQGNCHPLLQGQAGWGHQERVRALHALLCLAAVSSLPPREPLQGAVDAWSWCLSTLPPEGCSEQESGRAQGARSRYGDMQKEDTQGCTGKRGPSSWGPRSERFLSLLRNYWKGFSKGWSL